MISSAGCGALTIVASVGVLDREIERGADPGSTASTAPALGGVGEGLLQASTNSARSASLSGLVLPRFRPGVELVVPDTGASASPSRRRGPRFSRRLPGTCRRDSRARCGGCSSSSRSLRRLDRGVVGVREESILDHHAGPAAGLEHLDEVLEEQERRLPGADREVLLHLLPLACRRRGVGQHHVEAVASPGRRRGSRSACWSWTMFGASMPCRIMFMIAIT